MIPTYQLYALWPFPTAFSQRTTFRIRRIFNVHTQNQL